MSISPQRLAFWQKLLERGLLTRLPAIVDVGAMPAPESYHVLLEQGMAQVVAFEPDSSGCEQLNGLTPLLHCYPWVIGNGENRRFHRNAMPHTSSIFPSNLSLLANFGYSEQFQTLEISEVRTRRLDDLPEIQACDLLKLDVQGAELEVLQGAAGLLEQIMLVQTEVCFLPFYHDQPLFAEIDQALRAYGFMLHRFVGDAVVRESWIPALLPAHKNQLMWADAVYLRAPERITNCRPEQWLSMALILDLCYDSADAAARLLHLHDQHRNAPPHQSLLAEFAGRL